MFHKKNDHKEETMLQTKLINLIKPKFDEEKDVQK